MEAWEWSKAIVWGFHFGNPDFEKPALSTLMVRFAFDNSEASTLGTPMLKSQTYQDYGPLKNVVFLFLHWLRFWPWENTGHFAEWKDKNPCHFNIIDMYRFYFQIGRALGPVYIFWQISKSVVPHFCQLFSLLTQKLLETVGSLGVQRTILTSGGNVPPWW